MKSTFFCVITLSLLLAPVILYAQKEIENILQNPDFENVGNAPWTMWVEDKNCVAQMIVDKKESFEGKQSLLIDISKKGSGMRVELHQNPLVLKEGQKLTYAFWAKTEKDSIRPARMIVNHRADPWTSYLFKEITITEEWKEFWGTFVMPADDNIAGVYIELRDTVGRTWFDHFRLYEGDYFEEDFGQKEKAVNPYGNLISTWAKVKSNMEK
ncbi:MAG: carbohydrate binding domain-containing protein [bacterium]